MRVIPLAIRRDPIDVLGSLAAEPGAFLVDVPDPAEPTTLLGCAPAVELVVAADGTVTRSDGVSVPRDPLDAIEAFVADADSGGLPFPLGARVVGWLGYELGRFVEGERVRHPVASPMPLAVLARYDTVLAYDRARAQYAIVTDVTGTARAPWLERLSASPSTPAASLAATPLTALLPQADHHAAVGRILAYLEAGDAYQVNLTQPFATTLAGPAWALFAELARCHPVPYGAYLDLGGVRLVANSPELFLRRRGRRVETRPIKGTRARGRSPSLDAALAAELVRDEKERAEHVMIVDLERNDLGRVCTFGSVVVEALARVETHPTVHHLVSVIAGRLRDDVRLAALLRATFPGGSITGAPKVRAMEIIRELEPEPRGPYTGAFGAFHADGDVELGLAIRTAVVHGTSLRYHAGGGIVADSDPARELDEAWLKTAAIRLALGEDADGVAARCSSG
jgi:para-aminobenzoate synthetase component 1